MISYTYNLKIFSSPVQYTPKNPDFKKLIEEKITRQHFMHHNGFRLTKMEAGYMEAEAPLEQHLQQQDGFIHGGVTSTIADLVTGFAAFSLVSKDDRVVTSDLKISYFQPGKGDKIFARGWVIKPGNRLHYCESEVYSVDGDKLTLIAKGFAIMAIIEGKNKNVLS